MAGYSLLIKASAAKELEAMPTKDRTRLAATPPPPGSEKLSGEEKYRIRQCNHRILCLIEGAGSTVTIIKIGDRRRFNGTEAGLGSELAPRVDSLLNGMEEVDV